MSAPPAEKPVADCVIGLAPEAEPWQLPPGPPPNPLPVIENVEPDTVTLNCAGEEEKAPDPPEDGRTTVPAKPAEAPAAL